MFIAVDGIDGSGKTTLVRQLLDALKSFRPVATKEPTDSSHWGQQLRAAATNGRLPRDTEIDYFHKDRLHHIETVIQPALNAGHVVISDRYVDSMLAFQADSPNQADELYDRFLSDILVPDITFILDCPVEIGLARIKRNRPTTSAYEKRRVLERARKIYASRRGDHYVHLDASRTPSHTLEQAIKHLVTRFRQIEAYWASASLEREF